MADGLYRVLVDAFRESLSAGEVGVTLELREMEKATYRR